MSLKKLALTDIQGRFLEKSNSLALSEIIGNVFAILESYAPKSLI